MAVRDLTKSDFIFDCFRVDVAFQVGDIDLSEQAGFVIALDFVFMLQSVRASSKQEARSSLIYPIAKASGASAETATESACTPGTRPRTGGIADRPPGAAG